MFIYCSTDGFYAKIRNCFRKEKNKENSLTDYEKSLI